MKRFNIFLAAAALIALAAACATPVVSEAIDPSEPDNTAYNYEVAVDATNAEGILPNVVSNINVWGMGNAFHNPEITGDYNIFDFVEYVQFMTATGGNPSHTRDLFKNPTDKSVLDDYDFTNLIENCRGVISLGAKPHIKLGNVPYKLSDGFKIIGMDANVRPPADYNQYYTYIRAIVEALVAEFGKDEVLSWHWGIYTEYENQDWFEGYGTAESAAEEFCKIYDYSVQALIDVLGKDGLYVGAHSMTVTEGMWDERLFIKHCAEGTNWANGGKGSYITYLSASFYDSAPGIFTSGLDLPHTILHLKDAAESYGLKGLAYGVDEGRILGAAKGAQNNALCSRTTGYTYMAAYDARLYTQMINVGGSYLSSWAYLTKGLFEGNPSVCYHVASNIAGFAGMTKAAVACEDVAAIENAEIGALAGVDPTTGKTMVMLYNFANDIAYADTATVKLTVRTPLKPGIHSITFNKINDDCNYFDEWVQDRKELGITDEMFSWSPDDGCSVTSYMNNPEARAKFEELDATKYAELSKLIPKSGNIRVAKDGSVTLRCPLGGGNVWFIEIQ